MSATKLNDLFIDSVFFVFIVHAKQSGNPQFSEPTTKLKTSKQWFDWLKLAIFQLHTLPPWVEADMGSLASLAESLLNFYLV
jgi:hypothetical protein